MTEELKEILRRAAMPTPERHPVDKEATGKWEGHPRFYQLLNEIARIHHEKNQDYGAEHDPLVNFRGAERQGMDAWRGALLRMGDKMARLETYARRGHYAVKDEGFTDTLKDMAVYSLLCIVLFEEESYGPTKAE